MKTIYLDHNTLIYLVEGKNIQLTKKFDELLKSKSYTIVSSYWNILELSKGQPLQTMLLANCLDKIHPLWFIPSPPIYHLELKSFIFNSYYEKSQTLLYPFCKHLSEVFAYLSSAPVIANVTTLSLANYFINHLSEMLEIEKLQIHAANSLKQLSIAKEQGELSEIKDKSFQMQMGLYLPKYDPEGNLIETNEKLLLLKYCVKNKKKLYKSCPIFQIEEHLLDFRTSDPKRSPEKQDAIDLQHQILALTYCDYFVTNDGYLLSGNQYVQKKLKGKKLAISVRTIFDIS